MKKLVIVAAIAVSAAAMFIASCTKQDDSVVSTEVVPENLYFPEDKLLYIPDRQNGEYGNIGIMEHYERHSMFTPLCGYIEVPEGYEKVMMCSSELIGWFYINSDYSLRCQRTGIRTFVTWTQEGAKSRLVSINPKSYDDIEVGLYNDGQLCRRFHVGPISLKAGEIYKIELD